MLQWLGRIWDAAKDIAAVLWPARFSVGLLIVSFPFLWWLPQAQDALLALVADRQNPWSEGVFMLICLIWALETFFWAQFMSRLPRRPRPARQYDELRLLSDALLEDLNEGFPRVLGALALLVVAAATIKANWGNQFNCALILAAAAIDGGAYYALCWRRDALLQTRAALVRGAARALLATPLLGALLHGATPIHHTLTQAAQVPAPAAQQGPHRNLFRSLQADHGVAPDHAAPVIGPPPNKWLGVNLVGILLSLILYSIAGYFPARVRPIVAVSLAILWLILGIRHVAMIRGEFMDRRTKIWVLINFVLFIVIFICSIYSAQTLATIFGNLITAPPVILSVFAAWVFVGSFFIALPGERAHVPVLTIVVFLSIVWTLIFHDNHDVRLLSYPPLPKDDLTLQAAVDAWRKGAEAQWIKDGHPGPVPLVIVATAGGASRAGYWTAKVLGELEDAHPDFHKYVFAISSVSGGTLGAAVWRAMLEDRTAPCSEGSFAGCGRRYFCQDFLAPTFLTGLYADLAQRFLPGRLLPDRATALEQTWEVAWSNVMTKSDHNRFRAPFHELGVKTGDWRPLLLINGTSEKTGRRIITSQLMINAQEFPDAIDFFGVVNSEISLSTAAHNSARFPYIDAGGSIWITENRGSIKVDRIVDGGYFENFGAGTAFDLLQRLRQLPAHVEFLPVVVQISSDPDLTDTAGRAKEWREKLGFAMDVASDVTVPPTTFYDTRDALGFRATEVVEQSMDLDWEVPGRAKRYVEFRLTDRRAPMSWAMSSFAIQLIDDEWKNTNADRDALARLEAFLWPDSPLIDMSKATSGCEGAP